MAEGQTIINVDSPQVDAPVDVSFNFKGLYTDIKDSIDNVVDDIKSGSDEAIAALFLAGMFIFAGVFLWRRV